MQISLPLVTDYTNDIKPTNSYGPPGLQKSVLEAGEPPGEWAERRPVQVPAPGFGADVGCSVDL